jgi:hypothetical protein
MLLSNIFCILKGPFQGNINLPPFIFVTLGIHGTNFPSLKFSSSLFNPFVIYTTTEYG